MSKRRPGASSDLEEVRPNLFIVHNPALRPLLRGEGEVTGDRFLLTSQRREGLIARLRVRSFIVRTIDDLLTYLPGLPPIQPPGLPVVRLLASGERFSRLGGSPPAWQPIAPLPDRTPSQVELLPGEVVRRRHGRGAPEFVLIGGTRTANLEFKPLSEDLALLHAFAHISLRSPSSIALAVEGDGFLLPDLPLPTAYETFLRRIAEKTKPGWHIPAAGLPYVKDILDRLGIKVVGA
jgi:hypothetical protein